jgi:hypothetical protein
MVNQPTSLRSMCFKVAQTLTNGIVNLQYVFRRKVTGSAAFTYTRELSGRGTPGSGQPLYERVRKLEGWCDLG